MRFGVQQGHTMSGLAFQGLKRGLAVVVAEGRAVAPLASWRAPFASASDSFTDKIWGTQPNPGWEPPKKLPVPPAIENGKMVAIDPRVIGGKKCYPLIISAVVPRPIAFVSTVSKDGQQNLAPFSYFTAMHDPPCVVICVNRAATETAARRTPWRTSMRPRSSP